MSDIDDLAELINSKLSLNKKVPNEIEKEPNRSQPEIKFEIDMAQPNYQLLKLNLDTIPNYDGDPHTLEIFINVCDQIMNEHANAQNANDPINAFLRRAIISKLQGRALLLIGNRRELLNWTDIKNCLRLTFGDKRNTECLGQDLMYMKPFKNEGPQSFAARIQDLLSLITAKINASDIELIRKRYQLENYAQLGLATFIRGLNGRIQDLIRLRNPKTIEEAVGLVIEEENFIYGQKSLNFNNSEDRNSNNSRNHNRPNNKFQKYNTGEFNGYTRYNQFSNFPNIEQPLNFRNTNNNFQNNSSTRFPQQPINIQPIPQPPQRFFTNKEVFGAPSRKTNVFAPTGKTPQNPTQPMSTNTRLTNFNRSNNFTNYRNNNQNRMYQIEELHNIENNDHNEGNTANDDTEKDENFPVPGPSAITF